MKLLICPESRQPVFSADAVLLETVNQRIRAGALDNQGGRKLAERLEAGLVRQDGKVLYPVRDGSPVLLVSESVSLSGISKA